MRLMSCGILAGCAMIWATASPAQSRCGDAHVLKPGESLFAVAQTCRISLARIHALNPDLAAGAAPEAGTELRLAPRRGARDAESGLPATYRVREGDTAASVAESLGISMLELLHRNGNLDPQQIEPGDVLEVPDEDRGAPVFAQPLAGPPGTEVTLRADALRPGDFVTIGAGSSAGDWTPIGEARIGEEGRLDAVVAVPDDARPGDILTFFVDTDRGATLKSRDFDVLQAGPQAEEPVAVEGRIRRGVECPMLVTPDGALWGLIAEDRQFLPGDYVRVEGERKDVSVCRQGIAAVEVRSRTEIRAPGNLPRDTAAPKPEEVLGAWAPKGGNCKMPAFEITRDGERATVRTSVDGSPRTGRVAFAGDTTYIAFEMPYQELALERRGEGELAVIVPAGATASLGDVEIERGERVFVKCLG